ncbi:MAG: hypothetical protein ABI237_05595 [Ginsengibacter sp.]
MKKLFLSLLILCVITLAGIYWILPAPIVFSKVIIIKTKINIANRFLMDECKWGKWFPIDSASNFQTANNKNDYRYKNYSYSLEKKMLHAGEISISNNPMLLKSLIHIISINEDSIAVEWKSEMPERVNPIRKIKNYLTAKNLQNNMSDILSHLKIFLEQKEKVYGINLHIIISKDSTLIATKCVTANYPSTIDIYKLIESLKTYIISHGAKENNYPMLNIRKLSDTTFETMVAIPINKFLQGNDIIVNKRFVPWKVLTAEVKGGSYTVNEALHQMATYISDYHLEAMAIPFQSLVTDRSKQLDTLQWVTRIYTPVR